MRTLRLSNALPTLRDLQPASSKELFASRSEPHGGQKPIAVRANPMAAGMCEMAARARLGTACLEIVARAGSEPQAPTQDPDGCSKLLLETSLQPQGGSKVGSKWLLEGVALSSAVLCIVLLGTTLLCAWICTGSPTERAQVAESSCICVTGQIT